VKKNVNNSAAKSDPWTVACSVLLALLWILVLIVFLTPEATNGHGIEHATVRHMDQGGDGPQRHEAVFVTGCLLGSTMIALFVGLLAWSTMREPCRASADQGAASESAGHLACFLVGGLLFEAVFGMLCYSYWVSLTDPTADFVGPFPPGVSWMLFGVWLFPAFFVVLYVVSYHRWILPPENVQRFAELVSRTAGPNDSDAVNN